MTSKFLQLEQLITKYKGYDKNIVFNTVMLADNYRKVENNPEELKRFENESMTRYKVKHNLSMPDVLYNIELVKSLQDGTGLEMPGLENDLYVSGNNK